MDIGGTRVERQCFDVWKNWVLLWCMGLSLLMDNNEMNIPLEIIKSALQSYGADGDGAGDGAGADDGDGDDDGDDDGLQSSPLSQCWNVRDSVCCVTVALGDVATAIGNGVEQDAGNDNEVCPIGECPCVFSEETNLPKWFPQHFRFYRLRLHNRNLVFA